MSFHLLVGPPGSGKTARLLDRAREAANDGERVWWVGLPSQRGYVYRRATETGAVLGLEVLSSQQVYYRLLAHALKLKPLLVGTGRLAYVGEALLAVRGELPAPGEARLFAYAVAEAKRYGVPPGRIRVRAGDDETARFKRVYAAYEQLTEGQWDYDDFRLRALELAETSTARGEADLIVVDGFRELGPVELRLYRALGRHAEVIVALPEAPPGETPDETLPPRSFPPPEVYRAANPVAEARWVLRALKRDLASGSDPLELAVILPEREIRAFQALADEYGVPLMDETPRALADTLPGRLLLDLLELPDYPTASRLLAIPELQPLANAALARGVVGFEAMSALAEELDRAPLWRKWLALLDAEDDEMSWAETLLERSLPTVRRELLEREELDYARFKEHALQRAKEASRVGKGRHFRAWWAALLNETRLFDRPRGGVALLTPTLASGRRFKRAYLMRAVEGAYGVGEREDYFLPEETRVPLAGVFAALREDAPPRLPRRFQGRDRSFFAELRSRADRVVISYPEADQGGPRVPEPELTGTGAQPAPPLPALPAGSRLELPAETGWRPELRPLALGPVTVQALARYRDCGFRFWAERTLPDDDEIPWWLELRRALTGLGRLNPARLDDLRGRFPEAAGWLADRAETLSKLTFGVRLPDDGDGPRAVVDAAGRRGGEATLYRFVEPGGVSGGPGEAERRVNDAGRWNELWAAGHLLERYAGRVTRVHIALWPILGDPVPASGDGIDRPSGPIRSRQRRVRDTFERYRSGEVRPNPGFRCRDCRVSDLCREGSR